MNSRQRVTLVFLGLFIAFVSFIAGYAVHDIASDPESFRITADGKDWEPPDLGAEQGKVNVNTANKTELMDLPGIGPALADRILTYREEHGDFTDLAALTQVQGIGESTVEGLQEYACAQ